MATQKPLTGRARSFENIKKNIGRGRKKGEVNKVTKQVKDMILDCFEEIGGLPGFAAWARKNRTDFYKLYGKLLPIQLQGAGSRGAFEIYITKDEEKL